MRLAYATAAWAFVACLVVQVFLVGLDLFEVTGAERGVHREFAYLYGWLAPLLVLLAVGGRLPRRLLVLTVVLLVLFAVQTYLPSLAEELPALAAVHAVNALAVLWLAVSVAVAGRQQAQRVTTGGS
jgi:mercuric ion transport protein